MARGATGGNLLIADGYLLIAGSDELVALGPSRGPATVPEKKIACSKTTTFKPYTN